MDDQRERARQALEEYLAAERALQGLMGLGQELIPGQPVPATRISWDWIREYDAAEQRRDEAHRLWREEMANLSRARGQ
jgi:hypothetical protein